MFRATTLEHHLASTDGDAAVHIYFFYGFVTIRAGIMYEVCAARNLA
jgi:hypothetical protein